MRAQLLFLGGRPTRVMGGETTAPDGAGGHVLITPVLQALVAPSGPPEPGDSGFEWDSAGVRSMPPDGRPWRVDAPPGQRTLSAVSRGELVWWLYQGPSGSRLVQLDGRSGRPLAAGSVPTTTIAVDSTGRVIVAQEADILSGLPERSRRGFPAFTGDLAGGGTFGPSSLTGRISLVNLWASWCGPCREEMPALQELADAVDVPGFQYVSINDDPVPESGLAFLDQISVRPGILVLAAGRGERQLGAPGMPYTLLVDREGRVVYRWMGYGGQAQLQQIRYLLGALSRSD